MVVSHARYAAQSLGPSHPQLPPLAPLMHDGPASPVAHDAHMLPFWPQALFDCVMSQVVPLQQAPLHAWLAEQVVLQAPVAVLHASPTGHPLAEVHPASTLVSGMPESTVTTSATVESATPVSPPPLS